MWKEKTFEDTLFAVEAIDRAVKLIEKAGKLEIEHLLVQHSDETWTHDTLEEFYSDYRSAKPYYVDFGCQAGEPEAQTEISSRSRHRRLSQGELQSSD